MKLKTSVCIFIFFFFAFRALLAQQLPTDSVLFNPAIKNGKLKNGFQYFILNEPRSDKKVSFNLVVKVGYPDERPDQLGIAHLIEHLGVRATKNFPDGIRNFMFNNGVSSGSFNASTGDVTTYYFNVDANDKQLLKSGLLAFRDVCADVSFLPDQVDEERSGVEREMSNGNSKSFIAMYELRNRLLDNNINYPEKLSLEIKTVKETPIDAIVNFYKSWYNPINQAVVIVGDVNVEEAENEIKELFSDLKNIAVPKQRLHKTIPTIPLSGKNRIIVVEDGPGSSRIQLQVFKLRKSVLNVAHPKTMTEFRVSVMDELVNEMIKNRLEAIARSDKRAFQNVRQAIQRNSIVYDSGVDALSTQMVVKDNAQIGSGLTFMIREMQRLKKYSFSKPEFDLALYSYSNSPGSTMSTEHMLLNHYEYGRAVPANERLLKKRLAKEIELREINSFISDFLNQKGNLAITLLVPEGTKSELPFESVLLSWVDSAMNSDVNPYVQKNVREPILPQMKSIDAKGYTSKEISVLSATEVVLANGIKLMLKTLPENKVNGIDFILRGSKFYEVDKNEEEIMPLLKGLDSYVGIGSLNSAELSEWKDQQNKTGSMFSASPYIKSGESGIFGSAMNANAEKLFQLIHAYFKTASLDADAFQQNMNKIKAEGSRKVTKARALEDSIQSVMNDDPRHNKLFRENSITLDVNKAFHIYKDNFTYADGYSFVITGFFDKEAIIKLAACYLGTLPTSGKQPSAQIKKPVVNARTNKIQRGLKAVMVGDSTGNVDVRMLFRVKSASTVLDRLKLEVLREIIWRCLFVRLREKDKGVYGVSAEMQTAGHEQNYYLDVGFQTAPGDVDRLINSVQDELNRLSNGQLEDSTFQNAVEEVRKRVSRDMNSPYYWNTYLSGQIRRGEFSDEGLRRLELLNSITSKDVTDAMHKFFNLKEYALFEVL